MLGLLSSSRKKEKECCTSVGFTLYGNCALIEINQRPPLETLVQELEKVN
jgi:hypothetical protein